MDFSILTIIDLFFALVKNLVESISAGASASKLKADGKAFIYTGSSWVWGRYRIFAVTLHNIPEGMAVGVVYAGWVSGEAGVSISAAFALALGIALQNFPEGAIVSMPLRACGLPKIKTFWYGVLSGIVEPIAALITIAAVSTVISILPYLLAFAAGAMLYVVVEELIPEMSSGRHSNAGTVAFALGFVLMMVLDVALG